MLALNSLVLFFCGEVGYLVTAASCASRLRKSGAAFILNGPKYNQGSIANQNRIQLWAKKAGKTQRRAGGSTGGFGASTASSQKDKAKSKATDDYAVFPRLENSVAQTLEAAPPSWYLESGDLPEEIYQRLDQIYGFPDFNYEKEPDNSTPSSSTSGAASSSTSMADILSTPSTTSTGSSDLDSLLAAATGAPSTPAADESLSLNSLPSFSKFRILHIDPLVLAVDDFFTDEECDRYVASAAESNVKKNEKGSEVMQSRSPTVGKDAVSKAQRTSTTWYHHYKGVPELMAKASRLLGLNGISRWEEPQIVRYRRNEKFTWHLDALGPTENKSELGGQRIATLLVYLTELDEAEGGATMFRDLSFGADDESSTSDTLKMRPRKGSALLFFPAAGGIPNTPFDIRTLHCGEAVSSSSTQDKWISQLWLREGSYQPSAPPGNLHAAATEAISEYCQTTGASL